MTDVTIFGEYDADGNVVRDTRVCILTGAGFEAGDATFSIGGKYFYHVSAAAMAQHTDAVRAELEALVVSKKKPAKGQE